MLGGFGFYDGHDWEIISEYYRFRNSDDSGNSGTHSSWASFLQVGKTFGGNVTPYGRLEQAALDQTDNYFSSMTSGLSYTRKVLGARYDLNSKTAVKVELNRTDETKDGGEKFNEARVQMAVRF